MLNRVCLQGRLTKDVEVRNTVNQIAVASFTIACDRPFKNEATGKYDADFINCVAWRQTASFIGQYFRKGDQIVISGRIQTRSYDDNGQKRYVTEVVADEASFCGGGNKQDKPQAQPQIPQESSEELPFDI